LKHVSIIDGLRAIAALSVCTFHYVCQTIGINFPEFISNTFRFGQYGVYVFFVISGFIIPWSMHRNSYNLNSLPKFILKRLIRLEPPYLISIVLILIIEFIKANFNIGIPNKDIISLNQIALHFGYLINFFSNYKWLNQVYWTLAIEFQYYIIISLFYFMFIHSKISIRVIGYIIFYAIAILVSDPLQKHFPAYAPLFLIGIATFQYKIYLISTIEFTILLICGALFSSLYIETEIGIFGAITSIIIIFFSDKKIPIFNYFGKMSYSFYLIHPIIGAAVVNLLCRHCNTIFEKAGIVCLGIGTSLISAYIMYLLIEYPSKKLSSKIKL
jgi:peptidoglycan/LPS O-acetylase OafA/YrhL